MSTTETGNTRKLHEPIENHIHSKMCSEVNEAIIHIKIHQIDSSDADQQAKIMEARKKHPCPSWSDIVDLLTRVRDEMNKCTQPYKKYRD